LVRHQKIIKQCCEVFGGLDHVKKWPNESQGGYEVKFWDREVGRLNTEGGGDFTTVADRASPARRALYVPVM
jgi:hypothetical protein